MNYFDIYEKLYKIGYHSKLKNHGVNYVDYICANYKFKKIIDIGCSNGVAVNKFRKKDKHSYGMDVAHIAVRYAAEKVRVPNCILGSATDIPFKDNYFDAVFSCDMLEHLEEVDVGKAINEMVRISKKYLFIVLDCDYERNREWITKAKKEYPEEFNKIENLHLTVLEIRKWKRLFRSNHATFIKQKHGLYIFSVKK